MNPVTRMILVTLVLSSTTSAARAQTTDAGFDVLSSSMASVAKAMHASIRRNLADAAEAMPSDDYAFRATPQVRSFAQLIGHVAFANYLFCSQAQGAAPTSTPAAKTNFETLTDKAALVKALNESLVYCDGVYSATTDQTFGEAVRLIALGPIKATDTTRGAVLMFNTTHNTEHYGNIVVYLRLKGLVPPSTARAQQRQKN
jgi:uncharacterized damage-inducible protein DinB